MQPSEKPWKQSDLIFSGNAFRNKYKYESETKLSKTFIIRTKKIFFNKKYNDSSHIEYESDQTET